jgi:uncharacterized protein with HEPN domain
MQDAEGFVRGMTSEQFAADKRTLNAVLRSIEVIGEATKHIPEDIRLKYPDVSWKEMAGMRDKVIHFYFGVDADIVWRVVADRIPVLRPLLERVLRETEEQAQ